MKKLFTLIALLCFVTAVKAQKITKNIKDEFTKASIIETSWEKLKWGNGIMAFVRYRAVDKDYFLDVKFSSGSVLAVRENDPLMFKMEVDSILSLPAPDSHVGRIGEGAKGFANSEAFGIEISYPIPFSTIEYFSESFVHSLRIYFSDSYENIDIKENPRVTFRDLSRLFFKAIK